MLREYEVSINGREDLTGEIELLPCPFCGSVEVELINTHTASCWVECQACDAEAHGKHFATDSGISFPKHFKKAVESAARAWNSRV